MVLVLFWFLTVTVMVVPSHWMVWVTFPESFCTVMVNPLPLVLSTSIDKMSVSDMAGTVAGQARRPPLGAARD
jgi:hypothetical protein